METTVAANIQIRKLMREGDLDGCDLRISVEGGGCSGLSYKLDFVNERNPEDQIFPQDGFNIIVNPKSFLYVFGTVLDHSEGLNGKGFVFNNPNATRTCGCGESFSV